MKKFLAAAVAGLVLLGAAGLQLQTAAAAAICYSGKAPGAVTIDAVKDEGYDKSMLIEFGSNEAGRVRGWTMWDAQNIYVYCEVYDDNVVETPASLVESDYGLWNSDSVEIFIDRDYGRYQGYDKDDLQFRVDCDGNISGMNFLGMSSENLAHETANIDTAAKRQDYGYSIEVRIPLSVTVPGEEPGSEPLYTYSVEGKDGVKIGFDLMLNNSNEPGLRDAMAVWGGGGNSNASGWNTLQMMDEVPPELLVPSSTEVKIEEGENVALGKLATMSCGTAWSNFAYLAVDGNPLTYAMGNVNGLWELTIDLRYDINIDRISVQTDKNHYANKYKITYLDSEFGFWRDLYEVDDNDGTQAIERTFEPIRTRYIKFIPLETRGGGQTEEERYGHAICEIGVYASAAQTIFLDAKEDISSIIGNDSLTGSDIPATESADTVIERDGANNSPLAEPAGAFNANALLYSLAGVFAAAAVGCGIAVTVKAIRRKKHE